MRGRPDPLAQRVVGGHTRGLPEGLRPRGQHVRRQRQGRAGRHLQSPPGLPAARGVEGEPVAHGLAADAHKAGHGLAPVPLPTGQQIAHLDAWSLTTLMCMLEALRARLRIVGHDG